MSPDISEAAQADALLADWPRRLALIPETKPLDEEWMPARSPNTGRSTAENGEPRGAGLPPYWWRWDEEQPGRLIDATCEQPLPDEFPYRQHAAMHACRKTFLNVRDLTTLADAYEQTGRAECAKAIADLLARFAPIYPTLPVTVQEEAGSGHMPTHGPEIYGRRYAVRLSHAWVDTAHLMRWLTLYDRIRGCEQITRRQHEAIRELARAVLRYNALPNFLYFNDKYHNSLTDYYQVFVATARLWGQDLVVNDVVSQDVYTGGDLGQLAVNGPAGLRLFAANAFDREGVYWELSTSYTGYVFAHLGQMLRFLVGYSDPPGYEPGPAVEAFYEPLADFDPAAVLGEDLWRPVLAQTRLSLNGGQGIPSNDANYMYRVNPDWLESWGKTLHSDRISETARRARAFLDGQADNGLFEGSTLMAASGAVTLRGPANRLNTHLDWHPMQDYHSHADPLNLVLSADGYSTLSDLGYHLRHPLRWVVSFRTAAHNTVTVDRTDAAHHARGVLHHAALDGDVQMIEAGVPDAYPQCDRYRRCVVQVGDRYVVDVFRVAGGAAHDYTLLSRADETRTDLDVRWTGGTVADPDRPYEGIESLRTAQHEASEPYEAMHEAGLADGRAAFRVDWPQRDRPDLTSRVHHLSGQGARVVLAKVPHKDRRQNSEIRTDEILIVRRTGRPGLQSTFVSVLETLSETTGPLAGVRRLPVDSPDADAVAVEVTHESGVDVIVQATTAGPHRVAEHDLELAGTFAVVRRPADGGAADVTMLPGRLTLAGRAVEAPATQSARIASVEPTGRITLREPLDRPGELAGAWVGIRRTTGRTEHWRVTAAEPDGRALQLDTDHSKLVDFRGRIERVENERLFSAGVRLPQRPLPGTPIRLGPVGDYNSPRHTIEFAKQTGLPIRIGGTTTALQPRQYQLGLDVTATLTENDVGQTFWSSAVEAGDDLFFEPVTRRHLDH